VNENESLWLVRAQQGDSEAFTSLVEMYQRPVYNLCYRMLGNANDAEDAAQETFLRAYKSMQRYDRKRSFATWVLSIASHYCIDQLRKRRFTTFSLDDEERSWMEPPSKEPDPEMAMSMQEKQVHIQALLGKLSPKDRAAIVMRYWYDFSYDEISEALSLSVSAVKSRLHRARRELGSLFQGQASQSLSTEAVNSERVQHESPAF
jgi:RNA polymerase sigma-70 factor (ECF subfamily)